MDYFYAGGANLQVKYIDKDKKVKNVTNDQCVKKIIVEFLEKNGITIDKSTFEQIKNEMQNIETMDKFKEGLNEEHNNN